MSGSIADISGIVTRRGSWFETPPLFQHIDAGSSDLDPPVEAIGFHMSAVD
jgi:hypothetical protein